MNNSYSSSSEFSASPNKFSEIAEAENESDDLEEEYKLHGKHSSCYSEDDHYDNEVDNNLEEEILLKR